MADDSFQEKTEDATPKRLSEAREQGNVPKSVELNSVFILLFGLSALSFTGSELFNSLRHGFEIFYREAGSMVITSESIQFYVKLGIKSFVGLMAPFLATMIVGAVGVNVIQVGFFFATKKLQPKFTQLNPITGMKKFVSPKSLVELVKGFFKIAIVGTIAYRTLMGYSDVYLRLVNAELVAIMSFIATVMLQLGLRISAVLLFLAILDLAYQRWQFKKDMKMSKTEVKEESKQAEGDPLVKGAIRSMQQQRARERMMEKVPDADVVITNPTQLAIALKYDPESMQAPLVLAKGARLMAQRIREIAKEHNIPILENKPLARSLFKLCEIGKEVPAELFKAVAEVFAYVYALKNRNN